FISGLEKKLSKSPQDRTTLQLLATMYLTGKRDERKLEKAIPIFERLAELEPEQEDHSFRLAELYAQTKRYEKAARFLEGMLGKDERRNKSIRQRIVDLYVVAGQKNKALEWIPKMAGKGASFHELSNAARVYMRLGEEDKARSAFERAFAKAEDAQQRLEIRFQIVNMLTQNKQYDEAEKRLRSIIKDKSLSNEGRIEAKRVLFDVLDRAGKLGDLQIGKPDSE
ncbi:unnamed protein product, partial [marine sediment metagenome]